jgi:hypothetical protein
MWLADLGAQLTLRTAWMILGEWILLTRRRMSRREKDPWCPMMEGQVWTAREVSWNSG